jgi:O-antigen/teichoic acid export membrane protein
MLIRHSLSYLLARGVPGMVSLLAIPVYTRFLAPAEYGRYALVIAGVGFFNVIFFQWLRLSLLRFLPAHAQDTNLLVATILSAFLVVAVLIGAIGIGLGLLWPDPSWQPFILVGVILVWSQAWFELNLELNRILLRPRRYGLLLMVKAVSAVSLGIGFALLGLGAYAPLLGLLIGLALAIIVGLGEAIWWVRPKADPAQLRELLQYGLPLTATFALGFVVSTSDRFLLAGMLGEGWAGLYSAVYDFAQHSLTLLMMVVNLAAYPLAVRALEAKGPESARIQLRQNAVLLLTIALPASLGVAMLAPSIASTLFGAGFRELAEGLLPVFALAAFLAGVKACYFDLAFQLGRWTLGQLWVMSAAALTNLLLNLWWIPLFGVQGAAWATVMGFSVGLVLSILLGRKVFPVFFPW